MSEDSEGNGKWVAVREAEGNGKAGGRMLGRERGGEQGGVR